MSNKSWTPHHLCPTDRRTVHPVTRLVFTRSLLRNDGQLDHMTRLALGGVRSEVREVLFVD